MQEGVLAAVACLALAGCGSAELPGALADGRWQRVERSSYAHGRQIAAAKSERPELLRQEYPLVSIEDGVYYAQLVLSADHHREFIDCRPSDGIALALRADIPIFVDKDVLESAGQKFSDLPPLVDLSTFLRK